MRYNRTITSKNDLNPFHFQLPDSLYNDATYRSINGTKALYLDGRSYAETPALPIQTTSFSILCWMKVLSLSEQEIHIYSDWFSPYQFRFGMLRDKLCAHLRRDYPAFSNIVFFCIGWASYNLSIHWSLIFLNKKDESTSPVFLPFFLFCSAFCFCFYFCFFFRILEQDCEKINVICNLF